MKTTADIKTGIGSYAFRYAVGFGGFRPDVPMDVYKFLDEVGELGLLRCQVCENLPILHYSDPEFKKIKEYADERGIVIELGFRNLTEENLSRYMGIAEILQSPFLRVVLNEEGNPRETARNEEVIANSVKIIRKWLPVLKSRGITLGVENYFDHSNSRLIRMIEEIESPLVRLIFDTNNCFGFLVEPEQAFQEAAPYTVEIHLKDYKILKVEAGYFITGTVLGEGWLNSKAIIEDALRHNPDMTFLIEMAVKRREGASPAEVVAEEKRQISASVKELRALLAAAGQGQAAEDQSIKPGKGVTCGRTSPDS